MVYVPNRIFKLLVLGICFFCLGSVVLPGQEDPFEKAIKQTTKSLNVDELQGFSAAQYIRIRARQEFDRQKIGRLAHQLSSGDFQERTQAHARLLILPFLPDAIPVTDESLTPELRWRWQKIKQHHQAMDRQLLLAALESIDKNQTRGLLPALAQLIQREDESRIRHRIKTSFLVTSARSELAIIKPMLQSDSPAVMRTAAEALSQLLKSESIELLEPLLKNDNPETSFLVARLLTDFGYRPGLEQMARLLDSDQPQLRQRCWNILAAVTGHPLGRLPYTRSEKQTELIKACRLWLDQHLATVELKLPIRRSLLHSSNLGGRTMIVQDRNLILEYDENWKELTRVSMDGIIGAKKTIDGNYVVYSFDKKFLRLIDPRAKVLWEIKGVFNSAELLENGNILATTGGTQTAVEYDRVSRNVVWEYKTAAWINDARRMPNGNTLITSRHKISEVTPEKKVVWQYQRALDRKAYATAQPLSNGNILISTTGGTGIIHEISRKKKLIWELKGLGDVQDVFQDYQGHTLVMTNKLIREYDSGRKVIWEQKRQSSTFGEIRR